MVSILLAFCQHVNNRARKEVAMATCTPCHQVAVNHDVLISIDGSHVAYIAEQVVVNNNLSTPHQLRHRRHQPHTVADEPLEDILLCESSLKKLSGRRQFVDILGISETVSHHCGGDDDRG